MSNGTIRLLTDLLLDAQDDIRQKDRLIKILRSEVKRLNGQDRTEFDLSADSTPILMPRPQAG